MSLRPVVAAATMAILAAANVFLIWLELSPDESGQNYIAPAEVRATHTKARTDPLFGLRYISTERAANLAAMGLPEDLVRRTVAEIERVESRHGDRLAASIAAVEDPADLADALCGSTTDLRPRYGALRFFVEQVKGSRRVVDARRLGQLRRQEWSRLDSIGQVYEELELADGRKPDATLMAVAAILEQEEARALDGNAPWDRTGVGRWSWEQVIDKHPGVDEKVIQYFALMHLSTELAQAEGGFCGN